MKFLWEISSPFIPRIFAWLLHTFAKDCFTLLPKIPAYEVLGVRCSDRGDGEQVEHIQLASHIGFSKVASEETCKNQSRAIRFAYEHRSKWTDLKSSIWAGTEIRFWISATKRHNGTYNLQCWKAGFCKQCPGQPELNVWPLRESSNYPTSWPFWVWLVLLLPHVGGSWASVVGDGWGR